MGGEGVAFGGAEGVLGRVVDEKGERDVLDVAAEVARFDEMVAGVEVAVVLKGEGAAAGFGMDAEGGGLAGVSLQGNVEEIYEHIADVMLNPFIEEGGEETAVLFGEDGAIGDGAEANVFDDGYELDEADVKGFKVVVKAQGIAGVVAVQDAQDVYVDAVFLEEA